MKKTSIILTLLLTFCGSAFAQNSLQHAVDLYRAGDFQNAADEILRVHSSGTETNLSDLYLGIAYAYLGKQAEARDVLSRARRNGEAVVLDGETPLKIVKKVKAQSNGSLRSNQLIEIVLAVEFNSNKKIGLIVPLEKYRDNLLKSAIEAAKQMEFEPATSGGKPVTTVKLVAFTMFDVLSN